MFVKSLIFALAGIQLVLGASINANGNLNLQANGKAEPDSNVFSNTFNKAIDTGFQTLGQLKNQANQQLNNVQNQMNQGTQNLVNYGQNFQQQIGQAAQNLQQQISQNGQNALNFGQNQFNQAQQQIGQVGQNLQQQVSQVEQNLQQQVNQVGQNLQQQVNQVGQNLQEQVGQAAQNTLNYGQNQLNQAAQNAAQYGQNFQQQVNQIGQNLQGQINQVGQNTLNLGQNFQQQIGQAGQNLQNQVSQIGQNAMNIGQNQINQLQQQVGQAGQNVLNYGQNQINQAQQQIGQIGQNIQNQFNQGLSQFPNPLQGAGSLGLSPKPEFFPSNNGGQGNIQGSVQIQGLPNVQVGAEINMSKAQGQINAALEELKPKETEKQESAPTVVGQTTPSPAQETPAQNNAGSPAPTNVNTNQIPSEVNGSAAVEIPVNPTNPSQPSENVIPAQPSGGASDKGSVISGNINIQGNLAPGPIDNGVLPPQIFPATPQGNFAPSQVTGNFPIQGINIYGQYPPYNQGGLNVQISGGLNKNPFEIIQNTAQGIQSTANGVIQQVNGQAQQVLQQAMQQATQGIQGGMNMASNMVQGYIGRPFDVFKGVVNGAGQILGGLQGSGNIQGQGFNYPQQPILGYNYPQQQYLGYNPQGNFGVGFQYNFPQQNYNPLQGIYNPQPNNFRQQNNGLNPRANVQVSSEVNLGNGPQQLVHLAADGVKAGIGSVHNIAVSVADAAKNTAFGAIDGGTKLASDFLGIFGGNKKVEANANVNKQLNFGLGGQYQLQYQFPQNQYPQYRN